jgi:hypothetical protein
MSQASKKSWSQLKVREGKPADAVPAHIEALGQPDCPRWDHVSELMVLQSTGKIYSAATRAVPLLAELLTKRETPDKDTILVLLAATVCGSSRTRMVWGVNLERAEIKKFYARGTAREVWKETWKHRGTYVGLLNDPDAMVRSAAAFLLAFDFEGAAEVLPGLEKCAAGELEPKTKASQLMAIGLLRSYAPAAKATLDFSTIASDSSEDPLVRGAAVVAHIYANREPVNLSESEREILVQWCGLGEVDVDGYPWNNGVLDMHCARVVEGRCVEGGLVAAEILAEAIRRFGPGGRSSEWAGGILELAFEKAPYAVAAGPFMIDASLDEPSKYSERQKNLLEVLSSYSFAAPFLSYGIPEELRDRRRWLGLERPGPMERVVTVDVLGKQRTWPVWLCLKVQQASEPDKPIDVAALLGSVLTPTQLLEVRVEYAIYAYSLRLGERGAEDMLERSGEMLPWAIDYLDYMARICHQFGGTYNCGGSGSIRAMDILIKEGRADALVPEYDVLIHPSWRNILEVLPMPRRADIIASRVKGTLRDDAGAMWSAGVSNMVTRSLNNLDLYPTEVVANALFDVRDHIVAHGFTEFSDVCAAIETECSKLADSHPDVGAVVKGRMTRVTSE